MREEWSDTIATVTRCRLSWFRSRMPDAWISISGQSVYLLELEYQVEKRTYHCTLSSDTPYAVGTQHPLRYDAREPEKINHAGEIPGWSDWKKWLAIICGIGLAAIIIWFENR